MEVSFQFTRDDRVEVYTETYRAWLRRLEPLKPDERAGSIFFLIVSALAVVSLVGVWLAGLVLGFAWYFFVTAAVLLPFPCLMIFAVLRASANGTKRGLYHELVFHWELEGQLLAHLRPRQDRVLRYREAAGELELGHRYTLRLDAQSAILTTAYPVRDGPATTQEDRHPWNTVAAIDRTEKLLVVRLADGGLLCVPRSAFAAAEEEDEFVRTAEAHRAACRQRVMVPTP